MLNDTPLFINRQSPVTIDIFALVYNKPTNLLKVCLRDWQDEKIEYYATQKDKNYEVKKIIDCVYIC